jgi:hypothetical protein
MPMYKYHGQTNMMSSTNFYTASYVSGSSNGQEGVSFFYSSVENPHYMNQSQHMPMNERIDQFNSSYPVSYSQCSYATPYIIEKAVRPTYPIPYVSHIFHDSVPYFSNDYCQIDENSSNVHTHPHATLPTTSSPCVAESDSQINGMSTSMHTTMSPTSHTSYEQNSGISPSPLPNSHSSNLQHCVSQTCITLSQSKPISTWGKCLVVFKADLDRTCEEVLERISQRPIIAALSTMNKREASLAIQNHGGCEKTNIHDFSSKETVFISEKPSGQYLGSMCDESLTCHGLNSNLKSFGGFTFIFVSCGESCLLISWCAGDRCNMACGNEDRGRSRKPGVDDRR